MRSWRNKQKPVGQGRESRENKVKKERGREDKRKKGIKGEKRG